MKHLVRGLLVAVLILVGIFTYYWVWECYQRMKARIIVEEFERAGVVGNGE